MCYNKDKTTKTISVCLCFQEAELALLARDADAAALATMHEQLRDAKHRITELVHAYTRVTSDRDESHRRARTSGMHLAQHKLVVAHQERQLDRARKENNRLRSHAADVSAGRAPQVRPSDHFCTVLEPRGGRVGRPRAASTPLWPLFTPC